MSGLCKPFLIVGLNNIVVAQQTLPASTGARYFMRPKTSSEHRNAVAAGKKKNNRRTCLSYSWTRREQQKKKIICFPYGLCVVSSPPFFCLLGCCRPCFLFVPRFEDTTITPSVFPALDRTG
mmetsp:Transcript_43241/g.112247  ORF Transcript_43241/g.112247 Transcript_43241/m.112247 type:complete len:122 (-) Transcript_43241:311-676(-)